MLVEKPDVDVVIATHNRPEEVRAAIRAAVNQTYDGHVTVIVVFDQAEPDLTLAETTTNRDVKVITNSRTPGLAGARNSGVAEGEGDLVAFCDDDDLWDERKLAAQVDAMQASTDALTCVTGIVIAYEDHEVERIPAQATVSLGNLVRNRGMEAHPSTVMVRRAALQSSIGEVDEEIPGSYGEDFDWILRAAKAGPITVVPEAMVRVQWGQSLFSSRWPTIVEAIDYLIAKHPEFKQDPRAMGRLWGRRSFALAAMGSRRSAAREAFRTLRYNWRERRAYLAIAVASGAVSSQRLMDWAHRRGHGI